MIIALIRSLTYFSQEPSFQQYPHSIYIQVFKTPEIVNSTKAYEGTQRLLVEETLTTENYGGIELEIIHSEVDESKGKEKRRIHKPIEDEIEVVESEKTSQLPDIDASTFNIQHRFEVIPPLKNEEKENTFWSYGGYIQCHKFYILSYV